LSHIINVNVAGRTEITERDLALFQYLYDFSLMDLGQVGLYLFEGKAWSTVQNRITKLEKSGFVKRIKISRLLHPKDLRGVSTILQITPKGTRELRRHLPEMDFSGAVFDIRLSQLDHDLLLVDVAQAIKRGQPLSHIVDGRRFIKSKPGVFRVPDLVQIQPQRATANAIELELTSKSAKRYRQIILSCRASNAFEKVIFVTASNAIARKIQSEILGYKVKEGENPNTGRFEFLTLNELFEKQNESNSECKPKEQETN
jgi:DNA-binding MarR family transcriptional regulator